MDIDLLKVIITIILAILGWLVGHWFTSNRARSIKRREFVTEYLVNAYRQLDRFAACTISGEGTEESAQGINSAIADIQLFGSERQIDLAMEVSNTIVETHTVPNAKLIEMLKSLRNDLRLELGLPTTKKDIAHLYLRIRGL